MQTIKYDNNKEIIVNKSRFITFLFKINNFDEINLHLTDLKNKYNDATHHCYAYVFENKKKCSDDKEPSGTAGLPILSFLEKKELSNILCVVVRYFGGTKLGAGGLVRAYRKATLECLIENEIIELKKGFICEINFKYEDSKKVDNLLKENEIIEKDFDETITYKFKADKDKIKELKNYNLKIEKEVYL